MTKNDELKIKISSVAKRNAKALSDEYGISMSELVRMLLRNEYLANKARKLKLKNPERNK